MVEKERLAGAKEKEVEQKTKAMMEREKLLDKQKGDIEKKHEAIKKKEVDSAGVLEKERKVLK